MRHRSIRDNPQSAPGIRRFVLPAALAFGLVGGVVVAQNGTSGGERMNRGGVRLPAGAVEVVRTGEGASLVLASGDLDPQIPVAGRIITEPGGMTLGGPVDLLAAPGVSVRVPGGARMRIENGQEDGALCFVVEEGDARLSNGAVDLTLNGPARACVDAAGGFHDVTGRGSIRVGGDRVAFDGKGAVEDLLDAFQRVHIWDDDGGVLGAYYYDPRFDLPPTDDFDKVVSGSKAFR